ncbi:hypothetical protein SSCHL_0390 [Staphylococcus schleiferi]|nr:hypothetical protein SSCHL_0390 [Staphylococcus schleiferi]
MTQSKSTRHVNVRHHLLKTGTALCLVGSLFYYPISATSPSYAHASTQSDDDIQRLLDDAEHQINKMDSLNTDYKNDFLELLRANDDSQQSINKVIEEAEAANKKAKDAEKKDDVRPQLDSIDQRIEQLKKEVDRHQQETPQIKNRTDAPQPSHASASDDDDLSKLIDTINDLSKKETEQPKSEPAQNNDGTQGQSQSDNRQKQSNEIPKNDTTSDAQPDTFNDIAEEKRKHLSDTKDQLHQMDRDLTADRDTLHQKLNQRDEALKDLLNDRDSVVSQIDDMASKSVDDQSEDYLTQKRQHLDELQNKIGSRSDLSPKQQQKLHESAKTVASQLNQQNDEILSRLKAANDKQVAVKSILSDLYNDKQAEAIAKQIHTHGQNNQQIADQLQRAIDDLKQTHSDTLLLGMLDNTTHTKDLVTTLLNTRFDEQKSKYLAQKIMEGKPSNQEILNRLKKYYKENGKATSDDILNALLKQAHNKKDAIEAILDGRLNPDNASLIAQRISKDIHNTKDLLKLIHGELDAQANRLLTLQKQIKDVRNDFRTNINAILSPLRHLPTLDLTNQRHRLLLPSESTNDKLRKLLNQRPSGGLGGLFQHDFAPKPTIDPYQKVNKLATGDNFLDNLFDENGNFKLPDSGQITKNVALPIGIVVVILGIGLLIKYLKKRKQ